MALTKISTGMLKQDAASSDLNIDAGTLYIDVSNNRVGVANTSPAFNLDVSGTGQFTGSLEVDSSILTRQKLQISNGRLFEVKGTSSAFTIRDGSAAADRLTILAGGNVGIGITNPSWDFVVSNGGAGGLEFGPDGIASGTSFIQAYNRSSSTYDELRYYASEHQFYIGGSTHALNINSSGYIGIGTSSPVRPLHIHRTSNSQMQFTDDTSGSTSADGLRVGWNGTEGQLYLFENADLRFATNNSERMRIDSSGRVGIGTTSPGSNLHISSSGNTTAKITAGTNGSASLRLVNDAHEWDVNCQTTDTFAIYSHTDGAARLAILPTSGNVGIGNTSPSALLQVGVPLSSTAGIRVSGSNLNVDAGYQTTNVFGTASAPSLIFGGDSNTGFWHPASDTLAASTAGVERMRITSAGRVIIGDSGSATSDAMLSIEADAVGRDYVRGVTSTGFNNASLGSLSDNSAYFTLYDDNEAQTFLHRSDTQVTYMSGNVGIGTTSPGFKLEIADDTNGAVNLLRLRNSDSTYSQTFDFSLDTGKNLSITGASSNGGVIIKPGSYGTEIRRDAGGALGAKLVLRNYSNTAGSYVRLQLAPTQAGVDDRNVTIQGENVDGNNNMAMVFKVSAGASPAEAMRIDQNGNLLVGKQSAAFTSDGHEIRKDSYAGFTRDGGLPLLVNRRTSSGDMIEFYKDSTSIGTIGSIGGANLFINSKGSGGYGRLQANGTDIGVWWSNGFYPGTDASYDLGVNTASGRWRNLFLSGAFYSNNGYITSLLGINDTNTYINFAGSDQTRFYQGGTEKARFDTEGLRLATGSSIIRDYRTLYNGSAAANTVQYIKLYDRDSNTAGSENLHFYMRGYNHSEYSVEVKIFIPTYSGFTTSYGTMDAGQGIEVEIICGGLSSQGNVFQEIIEVANLSSTSDNTEIWLKTQVPHATTGISISEAADSTDTLIPTGNGSGWTTTAPSNQHRVFPIKIGKTINGIHTTRDSKLGVGTSTPAVGLHVYDASQGRVAIENASRRFDLAVDSNGLGFRDQSAAVTKMTLSSANSYLFLGHAGHSWGTFHAVSQIGRTGAVANYDSGGNQQTVIANNTYYGGSGYTSIEANSGSSYMNLNQGHVSFFTAPATTAGSAQTFTKRVQITNGGNVGIGTDSPASALSGSNTNLTIEDADGSDIKLKRTGGMDLSVGVTSSNTGYLWTSGSYNILIGTSGTERMRIKSDGKVGIGGTVMEGQKLNIEGWTQSNTRTPANAWLVGRGTGGDGLAIGTSASSPYATWFQSGYLPTMGTSNHYALSFNPHGGNVGVGTASPDAKFQVAYNGGHTSGNISISQSNLDLYNPLEANTDEKGAILTFSDHYQDANGYPRTIRAAIKGGTDTTGNTANGFLAFYTDSQGANSATERMRINYVGNLGIGTTSPNYKVDINAGAGNGINITGTSAYLRWNAGDIQIKNEGSYTMGFYTYNSSDSALNKRMVIDTNGTLRTTSSDGTAPTIGTGCVSIWGRSNSSSVGILRVYKTGDDGNIVDFYRTGNSLVGSISIDASGTQYNTTSDRRLKKNIEDADDAGQIIDSIQVRKFDWIEEDIHQRYGMIAQELNTVAPEAVFVPEDEEKMQSVDYSKLVPMLVKEVQSLRARVAELEGDK